MKIKETVGIDVSKLTLDVVVHTTQDYAQFDNNLTFIRENNSRT